MALLSVVVLVALGFVRGTHSGQVQPYSLVPSLLPTEEAYDVRMPVEDDRDYPKSGPGTLVHAMGSGRVLGTDGPVMRFRVGVESNVVGELAVFRSTVERTLADPRSWTGSQEQRFQRVPGEAPADFTIALVTRQTAYRMCATAGLDIRVDGVPYTSCQIPGRVVINLDRWREAVPDYVDSGASLDTYRQYVINHEVGHVLGRPHEPCPGRDRLAPVMQQQTLGLNGCRANPFPFP